MKTMFDELPLRDELRGRTPYGVPEVDAGVRLDGTESPYPLPDAVAEALGKALHGAVRELHRYPDLEVGALREDLANYLGYGLSASQVWAANGSSEIQQQLLQAFGGPGRTAMGFSPSYPLHPLLARNTATTWHDGRRSATFELTAEHARAQVRVYQPDIVFLCSPNNPTGSALGIDVIDTVASEAPGMVIVDEAYAEFARPGTPSAVTLLPRYPRLVVTRSMSAAFAFAGARVGYLAASPDVVDAVRLVRLPYHLSTLTQAAARAALANISVLQTEVDVVKTQRDHLVSGLRDLGLSVIDSDANFVLFGRFADQRSTWQTLLDRGVAVADVGLPGWLRVTAGTAHENRTFLAAMEGLPHGS
jgi:histidinol-phosphate aminotransferase